MQASIIIAFYNKIDYLQLILAGLERQTFKDFEVIIADDGSKQEVVAAIKEIIQVSSLSIQHVWHEDKGWRKNEMLNKAVEAAKSAYLIFIDGDCIPDDRFVAAHLATKTLGFALAGRRVNLSEKITKQVSPQKVRKGFFPKNIFNLLLAGILGKANHTEKILLIKLPWLTKLLNRKKRDLLGCNFSIHKADLIKINGFDERFQSPGVGEDLDIYRRLKLAGLDTKSVIYTALVYHLHHKKTIEPPQTWELLAITEKEENYFTPYGIVKSNID